MNNEVNVKNVRKWYMKGLWTKEMVQDAVKAKLLNQAEADKIFKLPVKR